jgi:D-amino peptidase
MKVYMVADLESASGAVAGPQMQPGVYGYEETRRIWMEDLNAAVQGALEGGAKEVLVNEAHYTFRNIAPELLHPEAQFITGYLKYGGQVAEVEGSDAVFMFTHAMAGTQGGVLAHTYLGREIYNLRINGRKMGELGINAALAGDSRIPVALVVGDAAAVNEAKELLGDQVIGVATKEGIDRYTAKCLSPLKSRALIREGARKAVQSLDRMKPFTVQPPIKLEIEFVGPSMAYFASMIPQVKRIDSRTISFENEDWKTVYQVLLVIINLCKLPLVNDPLYG